MVRLSFIFVFCLFLDENVDVKEAFKCERMVECETR